MVIRDSDLPLGSPEVMRPESCKLQSCLTNHSRMCIAWLCHHTSVSNKFPIDAVDKGVRESRSVLALRHANTTSQALLVIPLTSLVSQSQRMDRDAATVTAALDGRYAAWRWAPGSLVHVVTAIMGGRNCNLRVDNNALYTVLEPCRIDPLLLITA